MPNTEREMLEQHLRALKARNEEHGIRALCVLECLDDLNQEEECSEQSPQS